MLESAAFGVFVGMIIYAVVWLWRNDDATPTGRGGQARHDAPHSGRDRRGSAID